LIVTPLDRITGVFILAVPNSGGLPLAVPNSAYTMAPRSTYRLVPSMSAGIGVTGWRRRCAAARAFSALNVNLMVYAGETR